MMDFLLFLKEYLSSGFSKSTFGMFIFGVLIGGFVVWLYMSLVHNKIIRNKHEELKSQLDIIKVEKSQLDSQYTDLQRNYSELSQKYYENNSSLMMKAYNAQKVHDGAGLADAIRNG